MHILIIEKIHIVHFVLEFEVDIFEEMSFPSLNKSGFEITMIWGSGKNPLKANETSRACRDVS